MALETTQESACRLGLDTEVPCYLPAADATLDLDEPQHLNLPWRAGIPFWSIDVARVVNNGVAYRFQWIMAAPNLAPCAPR
jgi:hypothetical protein